jgi:hypothetical protein
MKNSSDTIGNGTRDISACIAVPQPTAPPRAPQRGTYDKFMCKNNTNYEEKNKGRSPPSRSASNTFMEKE